LLGFPHRLRALRRACWLASLLACGAARTVLADAPRGAPSDTGISQAPPVDPRLATEAPPDPDAPNATRPDGPTDLDATAEVGAEKDSLPDPGDTTPPPDDAPPADDDAPPAREGAQPPPDDAQPPTDGAQPPPDDAQPTDDDAQPPPDGAQPPTDDAQPPTEGAQPTDGAQPPEAPPASPETVRDTDPLGTVEAALARLAERGFVIREKQRSSTALQGEVLRAVISGPDTDLLLFTLSVAADDGFQILLDPEASDVFSLIALRTHPGQDPGVDFVNIDHVEIVGRFREAEDAPLLRRYGDLPPGGVVPIEVVERLGTIGYLSTFRALDADTIEIRVEPGRAIRRVRIRGRLPLPERALHRALSPFSRPGRLTLGPCVSPRTLRQAPPATVCKPDALLCREWEREEISRVERHLVDQGYFEGKAKLGLACGRGSDEADLWVMLDKGRGFRIGRIEITGNVSSTDQRWIRRMFRPSVGPLLPIPKRVTRAHIEEAKDRVEREYAEPRSGPRAASRSALQLPYPGVRVDTNFDTAKDRLPPRSRRIPLSVDVQLGSGVETSFRNNDRVAESRLLPQLQLFERREPATSMTATREAENLRAYYQSRGFTLAEVRGQYGTQGLLRQLRFDIREGPKLRLRAIDFTDTPSVPGPVDASIRRELRKGRKLAPRGAFSDNAARSDLGQILRAYAQAGYLCATAQLRVAFWPEGLDQPGAHATLDLLTKVDTAGSPTWIERQLSPEGLAALRKKRRGGVYVRVEVDPGPRIMTSGRETVRHLEIPIPQSRDLEGVPLADRGAWGAADMLQDGPLRRDTDARAGGIPLHLGLDRKAEREIERRYREHGFPIADSEIRWIYKSATGETHRVSQAERLTDPSVGLCQEQHNRSTTAVDTEISVYEGRTATFGSTLIRGNFKTRRWVIAREISWKEGEAYDRKQADVTRRRIEGTGTMETVQVLEQPTNCEFHDDPEQDCVVHEVISVQEAKDRAMDLEWGFGFATLDPFYVFIRPTFPNMFGTGWDLRIDAHYGTNIAIPRFCDSNEGCYERSGRLSLSRQRIFASVLGLELNGQIQRRATPARGVIDSALGELRLNLPIENEWHLHWSYLIQAANISKGVVKPTFGPSLGCANGGCSPPNRSEAIVPDRTGALETGVTWTRVDNAFNPEKGFIADADFLLASPYLGGLDWWVRLQASWQHFLPLPGREQRFAFRYALRYGHAIPIRGWPGSHTTSVPEVWRFFGGGTADLGMRGIEPQMMLVDIEEIPTGYGGSTLRPLAQGGHIRALATFALQVTTVRDFLGGRLAHSLFVDLGVLTQRWRDVVPLRDIRRSIGVNIVKWDIRIVTVSLGYAILVPNWIIPGNVRPTDDRNGRVVFDVGATF